MVLQRSSKALIMGQVRGGAVVMVQTPYNRETPAGRTINTSTITTNTTPR
jgi:hypothetical protein